jgi:uncharacterized protein
MAQTHRAISDLAVKSLGRSMGLFTELGFAFDPGFPDETAACTIVSDTTCVMPLTEARFQEFTPKVICDAPESTEVLVCLSCETPGPGRRARGCNDL